MSKHLLRQQSQKSGKAMVIGVAAAFDEAADDAPDAVADVAAAVAASNISGLGYVQCELAPWSTVVNVGRITAWPNDMPANCQSVACRCYMHPGCSITRRRTAFENDQLLAWLYSTKPLQPGVSSADKKLDKTRQMEAAGDLLPKAAAAGSGAASSSGPMPSIPA
jgi:hypothetical protein